MDSLERFRELAGWLAGTDIALLELRGPQTALCLRRDGPAEGEPVQVDAAALTIVTAPSVGVLRLRHPLREEALAAVGVRVVEGQALALLAIGHTLVPALAPRDGIVSRVLANDGDALGYGDPLVELLE